LTFSLSLVVMKPVVLSITRSRISSQSASFRSLTTFLPSYDLWQHYFGSP
jgi:hypothetical protein